MPLAQDSRPDCVRLLKLLSTKKHKEEKVDEDSDEEEVKEGEKPSSKKKPSRKKEKTPADAKLLVDPKKVTNQTLPQPKNIFQKLVLYTRRSHLCYLPPAC